MSCHLKGKRFSISLYLTGRTLPRCSTSSKPALADASIGVSGGGRNKRGTSLCSRFVQRIERYSMNRHDWKFTVAVSILHMKHD